MKAGFCHLCCPYLFFQDSRNIICMGRLSAPSHGSAWLTWSRAW